MQHLKVAAGSLPSIGIGGDTLEHISVKNKTKKVPLEVTTCVLFKCSFHIDFPFEKDPSPPPSLKQRGLLRLTFGSWGRWAEGQSERGSSGLQFILTVIRVRSPSVIEGSSAVNNSWGITSNPPPHCEEWALRCLPVQFGILTGRLGKFPSYSYLHHHPPLPLPSPIPPYYLQHLAWR